MGRFSPSRIVQKEGVLRLVRRPHRLHLHHCQPPPVTVQGMVDQPAKGETLPIHGQRQRPLPHRRLPLQSHRLQPGLDTTPSYLHHRVPQLRERQVFEEERNRSVRHSRHRALTLNSCRSLEVLSFGESTREKRLRVLMERLRGQK